MADVTLQVGELKWQSNGVIECNDKGFALLCEEVTDITFDDETIKNESIVFIRANRTFAGLDPDTGLPPE